MDCPRCGARLTRLSLNGELESVYCEECRFADVESDHTRASEGAETWDDALRRFRTLQTSGAEPDGEVDGAAETAGDSEADDDEAGSTGGADSADGAGDQADSDDETASARDGETASARDGERADEDVDPDAAESSKGGDMDSDDTDADIDDPGDDADDSEAALEDADTEAA